MKIDLIFLIIIGICIIFYFCTSSNTEHFDSMSDAKAAVNAVYQADVGAIRTLADAAAKLQANTFTIPGVVTTNNINISQGQWGTGHVGNGTGYIVNDNLHYKKLMIVGNNTAGGAREVGIWDNLNVSGTLNGPNLNRLGPVNSDWLRINDGASVGQTAVYGRMCIIDNRDSLGGLCVGDWQPNPGTGNILATGNITAQGNVTAGGNLAIPGYGNVKATLDRLSPIDAIQLFEIGRGAWNGARSGQFTVGTGKKLLQANFSFWVDGATRTNVYFTFQNHVGTTICSRTLSGFVNHGGNHTGQSCSYVFSNGEFPPGTYTLIAQASGNDRAQHVDGNDYLSATLLVIP
jgi:hypothetical protein